MNMSFLIYWKGFRRSPPTVNNVKNLNWIIIMERREYEPNGKMDFLVFIIEIKPIVMNN